MNGLQKNWRATIFLFLAGFVASTLARRNVTVNDSNPRIRYSPGDVLPQQACQRQPDNLECDGRWWTEVVKDSTRSTFQGDAHITWGLNTSLEFDFQGDHIYLYAVTFDFASRVRIAIDGGLPVRVDLRRPGTASTGGQLVWASNTLDGSRNHTIRLEYDPESYGNNPNSRRWLALDYLMYTVEDDSQDTGDGDPPPSHAPSPTLKRPIAASSPFGQPVVTPFQPSPTGGIVPADHRQPESKSSGLSTATQAGIAGGVTCAAVLIAVVFVICCMRRRRRAAVRIQSARFLRRPPSTLPAEELGLVDQDAFSTSEGSDYVAPLPSRQVRMPMTQYNITPDQRRYSAMFQSSAGSSIGPPVDERPPRPRVAPCDVPTSVGGTESIFLPPGPHPTPQFPSDGPWSPVSVPLIASSRLHCSRQGAASPWPQSP